MSDSQIPDWNRPTAAEVVKRNDRLLSKRSTWEPVWQELADYLMPNRGTVVRKRSPGTKTTTMIFDSTAIQSVELLAASLHGSMTSPATKWFALKMREEPLNDVEEIAEWLEDCAERMMKAFAESNLYSEIQETYLDLVWSGTGCLFQQEKEITEGGKFPGLMFRSFGAGQYVIEEDAEGRVIEAHYVVEMPVLAVVRKWGEKNVSEKLAERAKSKPEDVVEILHAVYPRDTYRKKKDGALPGRDKKFASFIVERQNKHILHEGGFDEFPFHVPRWRKAAGEQYGRGPGHTALADVRTLNRATELGLTAWNKVIDPPLQVEDDGVIVNVKLTPGSLNTVSKVGAIAPIESSGKFDIHFFEIERLRNDVRGHFFSDQLILREGPQMTAEEVRTRYEMMQRLLGPSIGRLEAELLNSLIDRTFQIMLRGEAFAPVPDILREVAAAGGGHIDVVYEGPLAKAQRSHQANAIMEIITFASGLEPVHPGATEMIDFDEAILETADIRGVPKKVLRTKEEAEERRAKKQEEAAAAMQAALAKEQAEAGKAAAETEQIEAETEASAPAVKMPRVRAVS